MLKKIKIPWWQPQIGEEEYKLIKKVMDDNYPNEGNVTELFEKKICDLLGCKHAVAVTSGTAAMFLSLKALGVGYGDEVIVPDVTFIATANAVEMCGAKPILVDVDKDTINISVEEMTKAITDKTKAVIPVHVSGRACKMNEVMEVAENKDIYVVEDSAEAFMSKHKERYLGTYGKTGCFSLSPFKTITTGQGGIIITDDSDLYVNLKELKDQGRPSRGTGGNDLHNVIGYNFKFTNVQAAIALGQLNYLDKRIERMKRNYKIYSESLENVNGISVFKFDIDNGEFPQWTDVLIENRDKLNEYLLSKGIDSRKFWFPIHRQKPYKLPDDNFPNSTRLSPKALWLPSAFTLSDDDINSVCDSIKEFMKK